MDDLNQLVKYFSEVRFEIIAGNKKHARVSVYYQLSEMPEETIKILKELETQWPFATQHCKDTILHVEYIVKANEVSKFLNDVYFKSRNLPSITGKYLVRT